MSNTEQMVSVPRELAETFDRSNSPPPAWAVEKLRTILDAPAAQHQGAPLGWVHGVGQEFTACPDHAHDLRAEGIDLTPIYSHGQHQGEPVAPWFYFADCADPDYSHLFNHESEAQTQVADHGGKVVKLWNLPPHSDAGEVERLRAGIRKHWRVVCNQRARIIDLRTQLAEAESKLIDKRDDLRASVRRRERLVRMVAERDALLRELPGAILRIYTALEAELKALAQVHAALERKP